MAWQSKLFAFSSMTRLGVPPLIVVHTDFPKTDPLCEGFHELVELGVPVTMAPQYKNDHPTEILYHPRNTPGSLYHAARISSADHLMLCDPDLVFRRPFELPEPKPLSAAWYWTMINYDRPSVQAAAEVLGVSTKGRHDLWCGVPYLVERTAAVELAEAWLEAIDMLEPRSDFQMYAFGLAALKLGITIDLEDVVEFNDEGSESRDRPIIHYGFGTDEWCKRTFTRPREIANVWRPPEISGDGVTVEICRQLREAGEFFASRRKEPSGGSCC